MSQPILEIKNISKSFKKVETVSPFSLTLEEGQIGVLLGGNGAGKSTIIKMVAGIFRPTGGEVFICGETYKNRQDYTEKISYMPDDYHYPNGLSVLEWLSFYGKLGRTPKEKTEEALRLVGLEKKKHEKVENLSKGMRQRLLFAQAFLRDPKLILLDEPTNGLDPYWVSTFADILVNLREQKKTLLMSTHQLDVAATIADVIIFLHQGKIHHIIETKDTEKDELHQRLYQINKEIYGFK